MSLLYNNTMEYISDGLRLENSKGIHMKNGFAMDIEPHK
jgi:hypothetical protein